jgi:meso-butanediol dehydrogenase/(S,S)-butanediol dehydrogenase/diacetyl reductase
MSELRRVVIVTGGSQNIGSAIVERFQQDGAKVVCADLNPSNRDDVDFIQTDISQESSVIELMAKVKQQYGHLDVLVNNAGICIEEKLQDTTVEQWDKVMNINVRGVFLTTKHAFELMRQSKCSPAIVNISSIEGLGANPLHSVYAASKAAVAGFTHNTALEYGPHGIRCNAVAPGWINTPFNEQLLDQYPDREQVEAQIKSLHPIGRLGVGEDVANTVFWLASTQSSFITGQEFVCDGGRLAKLPLPSL